jgi:hypothetical protein
MHELNEKDPVIAERYRKLAEATIKAIRKKGRPTKKKRISGRFA